MYTIVNRTKRKIISKKATIARSFFLRFIGLMFRKEMPEGQALIFYHAPSIHTFFMRFSIDLVFLDKNMQVIKMYQALKPFRVASCFRSFLTIEFPPYTILKSSIEIGDILGLETGENSRV